MKKGDFCHPFLFASVWLWPGRCRIVAVVVSVRRIAVAALVENRIVGFHRDYRINDGIIGTFTIGCDHASR